MNVSDTTPYGGPVLAQFEHVLVGEYNITMPISIEVGDPGVNQRLVFELYKYNQETTGFSYDGIWVQLWMNITAPQ